MNRRAKDHQILVIIEKMQKEIARYPHQIRGNRRLKGYAQKAYGIRFRSCRKSMLYDSSKTMRARRQEGKC